MKTYNRLRPAHNQQPLPLPRRKRGGRVNLENIAAYKAEIVWQAHSQLLARGRVNVGDICRTWAITPGGPSYKAIRVVLLDAGFSLQQVGLPTGQPSPEPAKPEPTTPEPICYKPFTYYAGA